MKRNSYAKYIIIFFSIISLLSSFLITSTKGYQCFVSGNGVLTFKDSNENYSFGKEILFETSINVLQDDDTSDITISTHTTSEPIYDDSMMNFHNLFASHSVTKGDDIDVLVIDTPVDHRHEIFSQENHISLTRSSCYVISCDYGAETVSSPQQAPLYTDDFPNYFDLSTNFLWPMDLYHGTFIAGLVKQVAPKANIISMGVDVARTDLLAKAHIEALDWAYGYLDNGGNIDIITISAYEDPKDNGLTTQLLSKTLSLMMDFDVMFTISTGNKILVDLSDNLCYGSMGNLDGVIGVGSISDGNYIYSDLGGTLTPGERILSGYNGYNDQDEKETDLEIMASACDLTSAYYCTVDEYYELEHLVATEMHGTSFSTPIVAGSCALLMAAGWNQGEIENSLKDLAIPAKEYNPGHSDEYYWKYFGNGILNVAGLLDVQDFDDDDLSDFDEFYDYNTDPFDSTTDCDYLTDGEEILTYGTNPLDPDTDDDYLFDHSEIWSWGTDPMNPDCDADGLLDGEETSVYYTDPLDKTTDGDAWEDGYEIHTTGTNPQKADSDNDGMIDNAEFMFWRSQGYTYSTSYAYCKDSDVDNDGLTDGYEYSHGLKPDDSDTDNDSMPDGYEVNNGLNPKVNDKYQDLDNDGLTNYYEYTIGTKPNDSDTDNDGYSDGWEIDNGYNPLDADSKPGGGGFIWW